MPGQIHKQARVLIIDDEQMAADVLCRILEAEGYQHVERILDSREAVAHYQRFKPDLVILDWMMPLLSGAEVLQQLRAEIGPADYLPILVVTALPHIETKQEALRCGATDFLNKPYDPSEIVLRVGNLIATVFLHLQLKRQNQLLEKRVAKRTAELKKANVSLEVKSAQREEAAQEALRITEEWEQSFDAVPDHICILDMDGKILRANRTMRERFEPIHGPLTGIDYRLCYCGTGTPDPQPPCAEVFVKKRPVVWEGKLPTLEGWHWIAAYPLSEKGVQWGAISVVRDMTARKEAEEALREAQEELETRVRERTEELGLANAALSTASLVQRRVTEALRRSETKLQLAIEGADLGTWDLDLINQTIEASPRLEEMFGMSVASGSVFEDYMQAVHPDDRERLRAELNRTIETGVPYEIEHRLVWPDGTVHWIAARGQARRSAAGEVLHITGVAHDITERMRVAEALRSSEERYQRVIANAPGMVYQFVQHVDGSMGFPYVSKGARSLFGLEPAEIEADAHLLIRRISPGDRVGFAESVAKSRATLQDWNWEGRFTGASGKETWIAGSSRPVRQANGDVMWDGLLIDITERKQSEEQLRTAARENSQLASAIANLSSGVVITDPNLPDHPIIFANSAFSDLTGYSSEETLGRNCRFLQGAETDRAIIQEIREAIANKQSFSRDVLNYRKDSSPFWIELTITPVFDAAGDLINFVGLQSDITERRLAVQELGVRASQQAAVAKLGELGLAGVDLETLFGETVVLVAKTLDVEFSKLLEILPDGDGLLLRAGIGWRDGVVGHAIEETGHGSQGGYTLLADGPVVLEDLQTERRFEPPPLLVEHGIISGISVVIQTPGGAFGVLAAHTRLHRMFGHNDINFLQAMANIVAAAVARRAVEQTLRDAKKEADRANAAKSEFLSRMSHELRTPLNGILGFAQLAELDAKTEDDRENVEQIKNAGAHLLQLINEILDLSSIEAGRMLLSIKPVPLRLSLESAVAVVRPLAAARNVALGDFVCDHYVLADDHRLRQVLLNFLSNAIKYNKEGGSVSLTCARTSHGSVRLEIKDTGDGIDAFDLTRVFEPFQRVQSHTRNVEGIGLGLAISQRLVHAMDGSIGVESERGVGSTFWMELPVAEGMWNGGDEIARPEISNQQSVISNPKTLLYIEDKLSNLRLVERILTQRPGIRMISALQGSIGLELAFEHQPDVVLLDLQLPDMNGDEVLTWLGASPRTKHIPVVMLSANAVGGEIERLKKLGARAYMTKPFEVHHLLSVLDSVLADVSGSGAPARQ